MPQKPGVMLYFDVMDSVKQLSDRHAGIMLRAILEYGSSGTLPELPAPVRLLWPMIQMRLDCDDRRYQQLHFKRKYAAHVRWCDKYGREALPYDMWMESEGTEEPQPLYG